MIRPKGPDVAGGEQDSGQKPVALAHDYITQRGGAERVVAIMAEAFPGAPLHTSLFDADATFAEFSGLDVRTSVLNRLPVLRHHHRLAFPLLAPVVSRMRIEADVTLASSSGWAHGMQTSGAKVVYCHAPARWLYQPDRYLGSDEGSLPRRLRRRLAAATLDLLSPSLRRRDLAWALGADRYLVNSSVIRDAVRDTYGIDAEVLAPPPALRTDGPLEPVPGIDWPFVLCVARLLPYKNVDTVISAVQRSSDIGLVVVGRGPDEGRLRELAAGHPRIRLLAGVSEESLRWLYASSIGLVAASYEDFGLTPLEAASFGKPTAALHAGGYLDTIDPGVNGLFFEHVDSAELPTAIHALAERQWDTAAIHAHAEAFGKARFIRRLQEVVAAAASGT